MSVNSSDDEEPLTELFQEPPGYFQPPPSHTFSSYTLTSGEALNLRLVGHNPLWVFHMVLSLLATTIQFLEVHSLIFKSLIYSQGHHIWNAAHSISAYLQTPSNTVRLIRGKSVLELGAGAGLPSLVAAILGARNVVVTDYPDADLVDNIQWNVDNCGALPPPQRSGIAVEGYAFGAPVEPLLKHLPRRGAETLSFDTLILADLLFNHHCHAQLVSTIQHTLARVPSARALVFFSPYRPWLLSADLAFFTMAQEGGFIIEKIGEELADKVMFRDDPGVSASSYGRVRTRVQDDGFQVCIFTDFWVGYWDSG